MSKRTISGLSLAYRSKAAAPLLAVITS